MANPIYNYEQGRASALESGLVFDERLIPVVDPAFAESELTQEQVDDMIHLHCHITLWQWNRRNYRWFHRIVIALYWLGFGKNLGHADDHRPVA